MKLSYGAIVQDARGRFGGTVHSAWRATRLVRRFRAPANPKTAAQLEVRRIFINATRAWTVQGSRTRAAWESFSVGKNFLGRNVYIARQVPALKDQVDLAELIGTPGDASTLPPVSLVVVPGVGQLVCTVVTPTPPTGWTVTGVVCYCIKDSDWSTAGVDVTQTEGEDLETPYEITLDGALATVLYQVAAFIIWEDPKGDARYSASLIDSDTPTA